VDRNLVSIAPGLFTWPAEAPRLIGSRCPECKEVTFPAQAGCPCCAREGCEPVELSTRGTLWTWTIQNFPPPPPYAGNPREFVPFGVGYVELPEGVRVEARLTQNDPAQLAIGMVMELAIEEFGADEAGNTRVTFAFRPVGD
jgi:uncharacterized OB-fold protein